MKICQMIHQLSCTQETYYNNTNVNANINGNANRIWTAMSHFTSSGVVCGSGRELGEKGDLILTTKTFKCLI